MKEKPVRIYLPRLKSEHPAVDGWIDEFFDINTKDRLVELVDDGSSILNVLESCSITREENSYRLQIKKLRYFHDGSEMSAIDVINSIINSIQTNNDPARIAEILKYSAANLKQSFRRLSRYRFEIHLKQAVPDLLDRLSLYAYNISKNGEGKIFSGPWQIREMNDKVCRLHKHSSHPDHSTPGPHQEVYVQALDPDTEINHFQDPFVALFPGIERKILGNALIDKQITLDLPRVVASALIIKPGILQNSHRHQVHRALQLFLARKSRWTRSALNHLFGSNHSLATRLEASKTRHEAPAMKKLMIACPEAPISKVFLDHLSTFLRKQSIEIQFTDTEENLESIDGILFSALQPVGQDIWTSDESFFKRMAAIPWLPLEMRREANRIIKINESSRKVKLARLWLKQLAEQAWLVPLYQTPLVLQTNLNIDFDERSYQLILSRLGSNIETRRREEMTQSTLAAIGAAVQMFAHDVKKPFSMLEGLLSILSNTKDPRQIQNLVEKHLPELRRTVQDVNGMIYDIMEIGSNSPIVKEPFSLTELISDCLAESPIELNGAESRIKIDLQHQSLIDGDRYKISRVTSNIIMNAWEACRKDDIISIKSRELVDQQEVEVHIHNTGSFIADDRRERIFDAFYTEGKLRGTGLGLAIAKKLVEAHGGNIGCNSSEESGTCFHFTLPTAAARDTFELSASKSPAQLTPTRLYRPLAILVVDDESIYRELIKTHVTAIKDRHLDLVDTPTYEKALDALNSHKFDLAIIDVDLNSEKNGLDLVRVMRQDLNFQGKVCLHSNRGIYELQRQASQCGADIFLPKPLNREYLYQLINACDSSLEQSNDETDLVWIIDDDVIFHEMWQAALADYFQVKSFISPEDLLQEIASDVTNRPAFIILDFLFSSSELTGKDLAREIQKHWQCPMFLATNYPMSQRDRADLPDGLELIAKEPELALSIVLKSVEQPE